jgi:hypothetical protein
MAKDKNKLKVVAGNDLLVLVRDIAVYKSIHGEVSPQAESQLLGVLYSWIDSIVEEYSPTSCKTCGKDLDD